MNGLYLVELIMRRFFLGLPQFTVFCGLTGFTQLIGAIKIFDFFLIIDLMTGFCDSFNNHYLVVIQ